MKIAAMRTRRQQTAIPIMPSTERPAFDSESKHKVSMT